MGPQGGAGARHAIPGAQVVHHLFPNVCHTHYPAIAPIVLDTCREFGIPYHVYPSVRPCARAAAGCWAVACLPRVPCFDRLHALRPGAPSLRGAKGLLCMAGDVISLQAMYKMCGIGATHSDAARTGDRKGKTALSPRASGPALTACSCAAVLGGAARPLPAPQEDGRAGRRAVSGDRGLTVQLSGAARTCSL